MISNVFCFAAIADKNKGTLYTNPNGTLPDLSIDGIQYYYVAYNYDTNYVHTVPVEDLTDATIIKTFDKIFKDMEKSHKPCLNITNNQAVASLEQYLEQKHCKWHFVEPSNHQDNAAGQAIQTWKNNSIRGLCSTNREWPLLLWDQLMEQGTVTLIFCRTLQKD